MYIVRITSSSFVQELMANEDDSILILLLKTFKEERIKNEKNAFKVPKIKTTKKAHTAPSCTEQKAKNRKG